jgi:hypothetical protein
MTLAKDVAKELERRKRNRRLASLAVLAGLIALAVTYLRCGKGWGLGGSGTGSGTGTGSGSAIAATADAGPLRCTVRVSAEGITVDGVEKTRDEAVAACAKKEGAVVTVTGDARQGDWDELRAALEAVGVKIFVRGQMGD